MGHSYGAFMTANLLAHSNLFRAGIARSRAYDRTLSPYGDRSEELTIGQLDQVSHATCQLEIEMREPTKIFLFS
jgi:hypothetical protein